jgi:hypothetical protein
MHDGKKSEGTMNTIEHDPFVKTSKQKHCRSVTAELYAALEAVLPFAEDEVEALRGGLDNWPEDAEKAQQGNEAVATARRLIAMKSRYIRRKFRAATKRKSDG